MERCIAGHTSLIMCNPSGYLEELSLQYHAVSAIAKERKRASVKKPAERIAVAHTELQLLRVQLEDVAKHALMTTLICYNTKPPSAHGARALLVNTLSHFAL